MRLGLAMYDRYTKGGLLPGSDSCPVGSPNAPPVDADRYRWFCNYYDAQIEFPERLVIDLLADCRKIAAADGLEFRLHTYCEATRSDDRFTVAANDAAIESIAVTPSVVVNATGASVDDSLRAISIDSKRLIGGTKGSHLITRNGHLREAIGAKGIYAEAADGRPVFILPFGHAVMAGTTDIPFEGDPAEAIASKNEIEYLIETVNGILPQVKLTAADVDQHYCGVRPLPYVDAATTSSITRRHWLHRHEGVEPPLFSVIGGKLTTCRQLAEDVAALVLPATRSDIRTTSRQRPLPGSVAGQAVEELEATVVDRFGLAAEQVDRMIKLCGQRVLELLLDDPANGDSQQTHLFPPGFVRGVIRQEQPRHLTDLIERRLMLVYEPRLSSSELRWLAELLAEEGVIARTGIDSEIAICVARLREFFGKSIETD